MEENTKELTMHRQFNVSRERVWKAWTDPGELAQWWGPRGVTNPVSEVDLRVGGAIHIVMLAGKELGNLAGQRWPMRGVFREVQEPEKLVFTNQAIDENGNMLIDGLTTVTIQEKDGVTDVTLHTTAKGIAPQSSQMLAGMEEGWNQSIDKLEEFVLK